jgi:thiol-disulfide isomerase/thioredoxin
MFRKRIKATHLDNLDELAALTADGKPVLIDFFQVDCRPCRIMSGIVDELAEEFADSAHVVKVDVRQVPGAVAAFTIRSTPTFVLLGRSQRTPSKKARKRTGGAPAAQPASVSPRWRASGLVKKDDLARVLETNGGSRAG